MEQGKSSPLIALLARVNLFNLVNPINHGLINKYIYYQ